jgi:hypothetical protein
MLEGFCCLCADDVPMTLARRCLADGSLVLPPSTGCAHQRWLDGSWSTCSCKPVKAGTWRAILKQQDGAVRKREADRAAVETVRPGREFVCCECGRSGLKYGGMGRCSTCYQRMRARMNGRKPNATIAEIPCPVCATPFKPYSRGEDRERRKACSQPCGRQLAAQTNRERSAVAS